MTAALPELGHLRAQLAHQSATLLDLTRRLAETVRLIDLALDESRQADGYPAAGAETCDRCGTRDGVTEGPDAEFYCGKCRWILDHPGVCWSCGQATDSRHDAECNHCKED